MTNLVTNPPIILNIMGCNLELSFDRISVLRQVYQTLVLEKELIVYVFTTCYLTRPVLWSVWIAGVHSHGANLQDGLANKPHY